MVRVSIFLLILLFCACFALTINADQWPVDWGNSYDYWGNNNLYLIGYYLPGDPPWNFNNTPHDRIVTETYVNPSTAPGGGQFPSAQFAIKRHDPADNDTYDFFTKNENGVYLLGTHDTAPGSPLPTVKFNSSLRVIPFPAEVGVTWNSSTTYTYLFFNYNCTVNGEVLSEGACTTPYGTRQSLCTRVMIHINMPLGMHLYSTTYHWLVPNLTNICHTSIDDDSATPSSFAVAEKMNPLQDCNTPMAGVQSRSLGNLRAMYK